jgi:hypothetical protein
MIDTNEVLRVVGEASAAFETWLSEEGRQARDTRKGDDVPSTLVYPADQREQALHEFEILSAAEALGTLAEEIQAECDRRMEAARRAALEIYYKAEELARDPEHAELIPHVAAMRAAYESEYGRPIPARGEGTGLVSPLSPPRGERAG